MKEILKKYKIVIFRTLGVFMLVLGFIVYFWAAPKEVLTQNEIAAANVARMEASARGISSQIKKKSATKPQTSKFIEELKNAQKKQIQYAMILSMILGALFLGYSFFSKPKNDSER